MEGERKPVDLAASLGVEWGKCWGGGGWSSPREGMLVPRSSYLCTQGLEEPQGVAGNLYISHKI